MNSSAYDTLFRWARRTTTSFGGLVLARPAREEPVALGMVYRLKHWPDLAPAQRTADIYRALSLMSHRPVNRGWFLRHSRMKARELDRLLQRLVSQGAVEAVDVSKFGRPAR